MDRSQPSIRNFFPKMERCRNSSDFEKSLMVGEEKDVSIVKVEPPKKSVQWVASSFDGFGDTVPLRQESSLWLERRASQGRKRAHTDDSLSRQCCSRLENSQRSRSTRPASSGQLWLDKHQPSCKAELAVHKKKVEELEVMLTQMLKTCERAGKGGRVLLLTGPAGVGKTAAVRVEAEHLGLQLQEWSNPLQASATFTPQQGAGEFSRVEGKQFDSQARQFENFLLRAAKYQPLQLRGFEAHDKKIILVEDIPNVYFRDSASFHQLIRRYQTSGHCPLVFVVSDTGSGDAILRSLFPRSLQEDIGLQSISFNPVAPTMMVKVLSRIAAQEASRVGGSPPSKLVIDYLATSSAGDLRSAINSLQFACSQDTADLNRTQVQARKGGSGRRLKYGGGGAKEEGQEGGGQALGTRDNSCFLYHAVGKVLYCKRADPNEDSGGLHSHPCLPPHLSHRHRDPLLLDPEGVVERSQAGSDYFASVLHQNYLDFYGELEDVVEASCYFSDADFFSSDWTSRGVMTDYASSIATRGVIFCNSQAACHNSTRPNLGWRPFHKSEWYSALKKYKDNSTNAQGLFRSWHWEPKVLQTELVPFLNCIAVSLHDPGQIAFVQEMSFFPRGIGMSQRRPERLGERDMEVEGAGEEEEGSQGRQDRLKEGEEGQDLPDSQHQVQPAAGPDVEEEAVIEDYDDDDDA